MLKEEEAETDFAAEQLSLPLQVPMIAFNATLIAAHAACDTCCIRASRGAAPRPLLHDRRMMIALHRRSVASSPKLMSALFSPPPPNDRCPTRGL
jgi:hypothetical protein